MQGRKGPALRSSSPIGRGPDEGGSVRVRPMADASAVERCDQFAAPGFDGVPDGTHGRAVPAHGLLSFLFS